MGKHIENKDQFTFDGETWKPTYWDQSEYYPDVLLVLGENVLRGTVTITVDRDYMLKTTNQSLSIRIPLPGKWKMYRKVVAW